MNDCDNPVTDTGRKNSVPWCDPAQACPVGIPNNTAEVSYVNGLPVFSLGAGVGSAEGGGDSCPPVPAPAIEFVAGAENIGEGEGLFGQLVSGVLQFLSLQFGSGFNVTNNGTSLLIELIDSGVVSWDDILSKPAEFPPSAHTHTLADITDAGSAAGADSTDFATAAQGATADTAIQPADLATVATSGAYADLSGTPTLGTAAAANVGDFATAAQGSTADSAVQPSDSATTLNMNTARLLGRNTGGVGAVEEIVLGTGLSFSGTTLNGTAAGSVATDSIWDVAGDLAVGTGANTAARLAVGSEGDVLSVVAGAVAWAAPAASGDVATDAIWDAAGDLAVGSGANTAARLAIGSEGDVLTVSGGAVAWGAPALGGGGDDFLTVQAFS